MVQRKQLLKVRILRLVFMVSIYHEIIVYVLLIILRHRQVQTFQLRELKIARFAFDFGVVYVLGNIRIRPVYFYSGSKLITFHAFNFNDSVLQ